MMDNLDAVFVVSSSLVALAAGAAAWSLHRQQVAALRRQLRDAEDSRQALEATTAVLHRRLAAADQALLMHDQRERRLVLELALAAGTPAHPTWQDTHPVMLPGHEFPPTQPLDLD